MKFLALTILSVLSVSPVVSRAAPFRTIQRIWAVEPEKIEAARAAYPGAFSDGIIIATFAGLKIGPEEVRDFERQKAFIGRMKAQGVDVEICVSSTIGHADSWQLVQGFPKMVGANGKTAAAIACPRATAFKDCMRGVFTTYAKLVPSVIWFDDDFRMSHHPPVDFGCFCGECLAHFTAESGVAMSREDLKAAILSDATANGVRVRAAWRGSCRGRACA